MFVGFTIQTVMLFLVGKMVSEVSSQAARIAELIIKTHP
jgi:hypothetical protein